MAVTVDPRTRIVLLVLAIVALAFTSDAHLLGLALAVLLAGTLVSGRAQLLPRVLKLVLPMAALVFLLTYYGAGRHEAIAAVLRLVGIATSAMLVLGATAPESLGNALVMGGMPYKAAFVFMAAMQFVPVIARRALAVRDAQRARGIRLDTGLLAVRNYPVLALPVLYQSFKLADELAEALESRGFARPGRTFRHIYRLGRLDWALIIGATLVTVVYAWWGGR